MYQHYTVHLLAQHECNMHTEQQVEVVTDVIAFWCFPCEANPSNFSHCNCFSSRIPFLFQYSYRAL